MRHKKHKNFLKLQAFLLQYVWWELTLAVIGAVSFLTIIVILFLPIGGGPRTITTSDPVPEVSSPQFLETVSDSLTVPIGKTDSVHLLNNGDEFLASVLADIDHAHSSIDFMTYIWKDGSMSDQILDHLDQKVQEGVPVRIVLDAFGALHAPHSKLDKFKKLGGKVSTYHSISIAPWNLSHNHKRNHRRAIIIDGTIGYTGGIAVDDKWLGDASATTSKQKEWRDIMVRTEGPMAQSIQGAFAEIWASTTGEILTGEAYYPLAKASPATVTYIPLSSTPSPDVLQLQKMIMLTILGAEHKLYIVSPYFLPDKPMRDALVAKAKAGVDVRVIVPNRLTDTPSVRYASRYFYQELMNAGVKIYEYQTSFIHAKYIVADGTWSLIGSPNMDNRSRKINEENAYGIADTTFGATMEDTYFADQGRSNEIILSDWKKRGLWERFREIFAQKFLKQY